MRRVEGCFRDGARSMRVVRASESVRTVSSFFFLPFLLRSLFRLFIHAKLCFRTRTNGTCIDLLVACRAHITISFL